MFPFIDAHVHLDQYEPNKAADIIRGLTLEGGAGLIAVSTSLASCLLNERLSEKYPKKVFPAFGFHPEQPPLGHEALERLVEWIRGRADRMYAVGEIGLPYYNRKKARKKGQRLEYEPYVRQLRSLLQLANEVQKPAVLHAVYEDAELACDLLDCYPRVRAHFHWFKGTDAVIRRMIGRRHFVSVTPDVLYEEETRHLVKLYPLQLIMAETDGPWPFEGPFAARETHPGMIRDSIRAIAELKGLSEREVSRVIYDNTVQFYGLPLPLFG